MHLIGPFRHGGEQFIRKGRVAIMVRCCRLGRKSVVVVVDAAAASGGFRVAVLRQRLRVCIIEILLVGPRQHGSHRCR